MPRFCEFTESATHRPIHINPRQVRFVRSVGEGQAQIVFDSEHSVGVTETAEVVRQALDNADRTESQLAQRRHDA
jgi:hypothetical protein